jgi:hypothetical protein
MEATLQQFGMSPTMGIMPENMKQKVCAELVAVI